ncbi:MAG: hypothetical protein AAGO57_08445, partial [Pseudomonadota bacterium]
RERRSPDDGVDECRSRRANVVGRDLNEVLAGRDALRAMLTEDAGPPNRPFEGFEVLSPARSYKNRHSSIMLAFEATAEAMANLTADQTTA